LHRRPDRRRRQPDEVEFEVHSPYTDPGFSAYDAFEREDLTSSVAVTDLPDVDTVGDYIEPGFAVSDNYESGLVSSVVVEGAVDTSTPGSYELTYRVSDSSGNPATPVRRLVRVEPLVIATVEIMAGGDVRITADTQAGASYRIMESSNLNDWSELATVATPTDQLDWVGSLSGDNTFVRIERVVN